MTNSETLERLVPDEIRDESSTGLETLRLHLDRYEFAARVAKGPRLLDMACGVGYGSALLAERRPDIASLIGVDVDGEAIAYARKRYESSNRVAYRLADAMTFAADEQFDTIVSLETIEHLPDPVGFSQRLAALLKSDGILVASVPITPSVDGNPHHLHDFSKKSFLEMMRRAGFSPGPELIQDQPFNPISIAARSDKRMADARPSLISFYMKNPDKLALRIKSTLLHGFKNRYATIAFKLH